MIVTSDFQVQLQEKL